MYGIASCKINVSITVDTANPFWCLHVTNWGLRRPIERQDAMKTIGQLSEEHYPSESIEQGCIPWEWSEMPNPWIILPKRNIWIRWLAHSKCHKRSSCNSVFCDIMIGDTPYLLMSLKLSSRKGDLMQLLSHKWWELLKSAVISGNHI